MNAEVRRIAPPECFAARWAGGGDFIDTYAAPLASADTRGLEELARQVLAMPPFWVRALLWTRDVSMAPFGVKSSTAVSEGARTAGVARIGFFPVQQRTAEELVLGADDIHLDFRVSIQLLVSGAGPRRLAATTAVRRHNLLGRAYLAVIYPFHVLIVREGLTRCARAGRTTS
ncbi:MAG: DUF2867 domain-containing protein [Alphaproteobacteria bacterium]|nr:DUF2867 domain-containing protein [Alphaproteobacteria bacterium]MBV8412352.1 DUF2867 domain-containing protein [Alphaproteobacteria bacterium]